MKERSNKETREKETGRDRISDKDRGRDREREREEKHLRIIINTYSIKTKGGNEAERETHTQREIRK